METVNITSCVCFALCTMTAEKKRGEKNVSALLKSVAWSFHMCIGEDIYLLYLLNAVNVRFSDYIIHILYVFIM